MITVNTLMTTAEFEAFLERPENQDRLFELIHGEIVEKVTHERHGLIVITLGGEIYIYLKQNPIARAGTEVSHSVDTENYLLPDLSVMLDIERPILERGAVPNMPALAVEVRSPSNTLKEQREKIQYYLANGTRLAWLVIPETRTIEVYTAAGMEVLTDSQTLTGGEVLPGFAMPVKILFE